MSQSTLDDDLFGEAAAEMRDDVESHLAAAREELPDADDVWETDAENVLGALNGLRSALDVGDAAEELRQAKKWYTMGVRADAFDDAADLEAEIEAVADLLELLTDADEQASALTATIPELRGALEEAHESDDGDDEE
jgi:hypothetical protein